MLQPGRYTLSSVEAARSDTCKGTAETGKRQVTRACTLPCANTRVSIAFACRCACTQAEGFPCLASAMSCARGWRIVPEAGTERVAKGWSSECLSLSSLVHDVFAVMG